MFLGVNGFSRRYTEVSAGVGHVYESKKDGGQTWTSISAPEPPGYPVNDVVVLPDSSLVVATDLGVIYRAADETQWTRVRLPASGHDSHGPLGRSRQEPVRQDTRPRHLAGCAAWQAR